MRSFLKFLVTAAAFMALAVACTANTAEPAAQPALPTVSPTAAPSGAELADLLGSSWELVTYGDQTPLPDTQLTLIFGADGVGGAAGCNSYFLGNFGLAAGQLTIGEAASTKMFCDGRMEQEEAFLTMLQSATALTVAGDTLRITTPTGDMVFQPAPAAEDSTAVAGPNLADLLGTEWDVVSYAGQTPLPNTQLTLRFTAEGVGGSAGCNSYGLGDFQLNEGQISMGLANSTMMFCEGLMDQEQAFLTLLQSAITLSFNGEQLVMSTLEGEIVFQSAEATAASGPNLADLIGSSWILVTYGDQPPLPDTQLSLLFLGDDGVRGVAGCNNYFLGAFQLNNGQISIEGPASTTVMFCEGLMEQEEAFLNMLQSATTLTVTDDTLRITTPAGDMVFQPAPAAVAGPNLIDLFGTDWDVVTYAGTPPLPETQLTLHFTDDGTGDGWAGCNNYGLGGIQLNNGQLSMWLTANTLGVCEGWMEQEQAFLAMLESATTATFNGDQLVIGTPEGEIVFQAAVYQTLESGAWVLSSIAQADALVSTAHDSAITAAFQNGQLTGAVGCNEYTASYEAAEGQLTLGPLAVTQRRCPERGEGERVAEFLATLPSAAGYSIERDTLTLLDADGRLLITFQSEK